MLSRRTKFSMVAHGMEALAEGATCKAVYPGVHDCLPDGLDPPKIGPVGLDGHAAYFGFMMPAGYESYFGFILALHLVDGVGYAGTSTSSAMADLLFPRAVKKVPPARGRTLPGIL